MARCPNRLVVKVGTSTLTDELGHARLCVFDRLARVLSDLHSMGLEVVLVSSGAVAAGAERLNMAGRPPVPGMKRAAAAVGQWNIMRLYGRFFEEYGKTIAQILLSEEDLEGGERRERLSGTLDALLEMGVIPVVNGNDPVSRARADAAGWKFGDNDTLSAEVAVLCGARRLVILSDVDGLYDGDPRLCPQAALIGRVERIDDWICALAGGAGSQRGTGGMQTKLQAARLAADRGIDTILANGGRPEVLREIVRGGRVGTLFPGKAGGFSACPEGGGAVGPERF